MRKWCLSFVLPVLLLIAQQGALWHEIGHLQREASTQAPSEGKPAAADKLCETCLAYSAMAALAQPSVPPMPLAETRDTAPVSERVASLAAEAPAARSRGPPSTL